MSDPTEDIRREQQAEVNSPDYSPDGQTWDTSELQRDFDVQGFIAPYVVVRRKSDGRIGTLMFKHYPRIYFGWAPDGGE